jgi:DNA-binding NarL/FixJ family response regulator
MEQIKLLLVDWEPSLLRGLRMRLEIEADLQIVGEARCADDVQRLARATEPDVIVLDVDRAGSAGAAVDLLRSLAPAHTVVALSLHDDAEVAVPLIEAGAAAFVCKHDPSELLIAAIRDAASNRETRRETQ